MINLGGKEFPFEKYTMRHGAYVEDLCGYGVSQLIEEMQRLKQLLFSFDRC